MAMLPVKGKKWVIGKAFDGPLSDSNFRVERFDLPKLNDGEVLLEAEWLTVDPYMRQAMRGVPSGTTIVGEQVARVIESKNTLYHRGMHVLTQPGWVTHSVSDGKGLTKIDPYFPKDLPLSLALGVIGMTGRTAWIGLDLARIKAGETVFVSNAAGAVGAVAGQIAKLRGCRVLGSAGSEEKLEHLRQLGFDEVFNYKEVKDLDAKIKELAPDGVDVYFDNVGGEFYMTMLQNMKDLGRVVVCGAISEYNKEDPPKYPSVHWHLVWHSIQILGFANFHYPHLYAPAHKELAEWVQKGQLKYREHVTEGFQNTPKAFMELFHGTNKGKAVVKV